jgi:hypothetical protein
MRLLVRPDEVLPGDLCTPKRGRYAGLPCEVTDVRRGRYSTYHVIVRPLEASTDAYGVDYNETLDVERPDPR